MRARETAIALVLQALEIEGLDFNSRQVLQKKLYLLQELGTDLGFQYDWFVYRPYAPALTDFLEENGRWVLAAHIPDRRLRPEVMAAIAAANGLAEKRPLRLSQTAWHRLLASLQYICTQWQQPADSLPGKLMEYLPEFTAADCRAGAEVLEGSGLLRNYTCRKREPAYEAPYTDMRIETQLKPDSDCLGLL